MQTIGERLEEARKRKGISIREAAEATKIRGDYLHKFESNQFDINLPEIYVRGFLRTYASYLKLPAEKIAADYNALGLGGERDSKSSRSLNREIYGRMDLSVSTSKDAAKEPAPEKTAPAEGPAGGDTAPRNPATFIPRPAGLQFDTGLLLKFGGLIVGAIVVILLLVWGISAILNRSSTPSSPPAATATAEKQLIVVALDTVRVKLTQLADGAVVFDGQMVRGESRSFPKRGTIRMQASALENVEIEMNGVRYPTRMRGSGAVDIQ
ncbi:MAG TPA: helix-turn-helix domain-containing protein [Opitutaceae bacterium]